MSSWPPSWAGEAPTAFRILASYDEDATTMAVEAARRALAGADSPPGAIFFATTTPPYLDKTNATAIHAALDLGHEGSPSIWPGRHGRRSARPAPRRPTGGLALMSDLRTGLPASVEERTGPTERRRFCSDPPMTRR